MGLWQRAKALITPLACAGVPLDSDVFALDNSGTRKDDASRTYAGTDGVSPIAAYLGQAGSCLALELRDGCWHSATETAYTLERVLPRAQEQTEAPGTFRPKAIIERYADHGTHEALHSEFKTDLHLERLPSGRPVLSAVEGFATNDLILSRAMLAYNVLRLIGQSAPLSEDAPVRHPACLFGARRQAKRRRLKTVIQDRITVSAKLVPHARQTLLQFGRHGSALVVFIRISAAWSTA